MFGTAPMHHPRTNLRCLEEELSGTYLRLVGVSFEHPSRDDFFKRNDKPGTLFYCDPPYYKSPVYTHNLELAEYQQMATVLAVINSRFILGTNGHADIREMFKGFKVRQVRLKYTVSKGKQNRGRKLLITIFLTLRMEVILSAPQFFVPEI